MNGKVKTAVMVLALALNALCAAFFALALSRKTASLAVLDMDGKETVYSTAACAVSVPREGAGVVFGTVELSLKTGDEAALQFSVLSEGRQLNLAVEPLYDRDIIAVEKSGYGLVVKALKPGETVMQTLTAEGIRDAAKIVVGEAGGGR